MMNLIAQDSKVFKQAVRVNGEDFRKLFFKIERGKIVRFRERPKRTNKLVIGLYQRRKKEQPEMLVYHPSGVVNIRLSDWLTITHYAMTTGNRWLAIDSELQINYKGGIKK